MLPAFSQNLQEAFENQHTDKQRAKKKNKPNI